MPPVGFEPTIPASERPKTHVLERAATGIGKSGKYAYQVPTYLLIYVSLGYYN
jgi:hypothetical protein